MKGYKQDTKISPRKKEAMSGLKKVPGMKCGGMHKGMKMPAKKK